MKQRRALVLGSNAGQADLIRYLGETGWHVTACARSSGGVGEILADAFEPIDIKDVAAVEALAADIRADLVYSVSSDVAVRTVVAVSQRLGLPHFFDGDFIDLLNDKPRLREYLNDRGLGAVPFARVRRPEDWQGWSYFPCIVKPADSQGSRAVSKIADPAGLAAAVSAACAASPSSSAILEAFLDGVEISFNVLVSDGRIVICQVSERLVHPEPMIGIPSGHLIPPVAPAAKQLEAAEQLVRRVTESFGIDNGTLYYQLKLTPAGPRIVEIAPRLDGCHIWRLMKHACGVDFLELSVRRLLGEKVSAPTGQSPSAVYELLFQQSPPGGVFRSADFPVPDGVLHHEYRYQDGETVQSVNGQMEVVGYYVRRRSGGDGAAKEGAE
jgi:biotin carboxylase